MMGCVGADAGAATEALEGRRLTVAEYEAQFEPAQTLIGPAAEHEADLRERGINATFGTGNGPQNGNWCSAGGPNSCPLVF